MGRVLFFIVVGAVAGGILGGAVADFFGLEGAARAILGALFGMIGAVAGQAVGEEE